MRGFASMRLIKYRDIVLSRTSFFIFFFQAEDGIRDLTVTGVQTCALPISPADAWMAEQCDYLLAYEWDTYHAQRPIAYTNWPTLDPLSHSTEPTLDEEQQIGRASCRERV